MKQPDFIVLDIETKRLTDEAGQVAWLHFAAKWDSTRAPTPTLRAGVWSSWPETDDKRRLAIRESFAPWLSRI